MDKKLFHVCKAAKVAKLVIDRNKAEGKGDWFKAALLQVQLKQVIASTFTEQGELMDKKTTKIYFHGQTELEAKTACHNLLSILDADEIREFKSICVFDIKRPNKYRCFTEIILKGENYMSMVKPSTDKEYEARWDAETLAQAHPKAASES